MCIKLDGPDIAGFDADLFPNGICQALEINNEQKMEKSNAHPWTQTEKNKSFTSSNWKLQDFEENNKLATPRGRLKLASEKEFQRTIARLTSRVQELELQQCDSSTDNEMEIENRSLKAELDESKQKMKQLQQNIFDLKKQCQKQVKSPNTMDEQASNECKGKKKDGDRDYLDVNFKYLKHVILKYMCSTNEQSRQLVGVIGHLLQFSSRESSIVIDCFDWKLPLEK